MNPIKLLQIEWYKMRYYRTFWVIMILFFVLQGLTVSSGMLVLEWLKVKVPADSGIDFTKIPLYFFPDIWQNLTYVSVYFKVIPAILVIITISNEFSNRTIKQNIIDGMSRAEFVMSKFLFIVVITAISTLFVVLIGLISGLIYTPSPSLNEIFTDFSFIGAYFLDLLAYLTMAFLIAMLIRRSGLSIALLLLALPIEYIFTANIPDALDAIIPYFPQHAINNLIHFPFSRYAFLEIVDYVPVNMVFTVILYILLFYGLISLKLKKSDL